MAHTSDYEKQLLETGRLVAEALDRSANRRRSNQGRLVYQSRSGPPSQPWLEPDIRDYLRELKAQGGSSDVVIVPIGFVSDHLEVLFDLDTEALELCGQLDLHMVRAETVGTHPRFISMIRELIVERTDESQPRPAVGLLGPRPDVCAEDCCPTPRHPAAPSK